jgi:molybdate transport system substrate-binding protein
MKCRTLLGVAVIPIIVAGCSSSGSTAPTQGGSTAALHGTITVDAASSLTEAFTTLGDRFEKAHPGTHVTFDFGASSDLATEIDNGAPVDVFAAASTTTMASVTSAIHPSDFATNTAEIATPPGNPAHITSLADLAKPGVKVAVCDPTVPCGVLATDVFANAKITVKPAAQETDVKSVVAAVQSGEVDAGIIYVSDVREAGKQVNGVPIPAADNSTTTYQIAPLRGAGNASGARAFVALVRSAAGLRVLAGDGFRTS